MDDDVERDYTENEVEHSEGHAAYAVMDSHAADKEVNTQSC